MSISGEISTIYQLRVSLRQTFLPSESLSTAMTSGPVSLRRARDLMVHTAGGSATLTFTHEMSEKHHTWVVRLAELCGHTIANAPNNLFIRRDLV